MEGFVLSPGLGSIEMTQMASGSMLLKTPFAVSLCNWQFQSLSFLVVSTFYAVATYTVHYWPSGIKSLWQPDTFCLLFKGHLLQKKKKKLLIFKKYEFIIFLHGNGDQWISSTVISNALALVDTFCSRW